MGAQSHDILEVPLAIQTAEPAFDPIAATYQAGKLETDGERSGVRGADAGSWTASGFIDSYFGSEETVDGYHQLVETARHMRRPIAGQSEDFGPSRNDFCGSTNPHCKAKAPGSKFS
jgi:hypothetical protein